MLKKTKDYQLLLASVLIFYFVLTFDAHAFSEPGVMDYLRATLALLSLIYLVWYNVRNFKSKGKKPVKFEKSEGR